MIKKVVKKVCIWLLEHAAYHFVPSNTLTHISAEEAEMCLNKHSPDPKSTVICNHSWAAPEYDLTIIIPVYNVAKHLKQCMDSVINQKTGYHIQIIAVDDGSTDDSASILQQYARYENVLILHQQNQGFSGARNTGLRYVNGRYIMFVDSDDFLHEYTVQSLMDAAQARNADLVQGGYCHFDTVRQRIYNPVLYRNQDHVPPNGVLAGMAWGKLYRAELFQNLCFPKDYWYEDTIITGIVSHLAKSIVTVEDMVYYYRNNQEGITRTSVGKPKSIDAFWIQRCVLQERKKLGLVTDSAFYEHLLRMAVLCFQRTQREPEAVKQSIFVLLRQMLLAERPDSFTPCAHYRALDQSIQLGAYQRYCFLSKCFNYR